MPDNTNDARDVYARAKERISLYVNEKVKNDWQDFINVNKGTIPTFSELIRKSVHSFIEDSNKRKNSLLELDQITIPYISHALKEPLTSIKGYSQFLLENNNFKGKISDDVKKILKNILEQSILLENKIISCLDNTKIHNHEYNTPDSKVESQLREYQANGYFLKQFDLIDDDEDRYPYPYIFKPPEPPGDLGVVPQLLVKKSIEKEPEDEYYCQYCGMKLTDGERISHNCRKNPD